MSAQEPVNRLWSMNAQKPVNRVWAMIEAAGWEVDWAIDRYPRLDVFGPGDFNLFPLSEEEREAYKHAPMESEKEREMLATVTFYEWENSKKKAALGFIVQAIALADSTPEAQPAAVRKGGRL